IAARIKRWLGFDPGQLFVTVTQELFNLIGQGILDLVQQTLTPTLSKLAGMPLPTSGASVLNLTNATVSLQSTNTAVGTPIPNSLQVQPQGPGTTSIYADVSKFLLGSQGNACKAAQVS